MRSRGVSGRPCVGWLLAVVASVLLGGCLSSGAQRSAATPTSVPPGEPTLPAGTPAAAAAEEPTLTLGVLLPAAGPLEPVGAAVTRGVDLAVDDITSAGGIGGGTVAVLRADEGGEATLAAESTDQLFRSGADAIVGPVAAGLQQAVAERVVTARGAQCSATSTLPALAEGSQSPGVFRTARSDGLQGVALATLLVEDGHRRVALIGRGDYGHDLLDATRKALRLQGVPVAAEAVYDGDADEAQLREAAASVAEASPEAVVVVAFDEAPQVIDALVRAGAGPADVAVYGTHGLRSTTLASATGDAGGLEGLRGTALAETTAEAFQRRLAPDTSAADARHAAQAYDCAVVLALAAVTARIGADGTLPDHVTGVASDGERCTTFADCAELLLAGTDIDYEGVSGPLDLDATGQPRQGLVAVWEFRDGTPVTVAHVRAGLP